MDVRIVIIALVLMLSTPMIGQKAISFDLYKSIGISTNKDVKIFDANYGLEIGYHFDWKNMNWVTGLDVRVIDWGNQSGIFLGQNRSLIKKDNWRLIYDYKLQVNIPLFYNQFLLGYGARSNMYFDFKLYKSIDCRVGAGLRFDSLPGYKQYGTITSTFEIPLTISLKKNFGGGDSDN